jgi:ABC-type transport system involved in multi-copper enzyme maturation permease subunit
MIRFAWLQFRVQAAAVLAALTVLEIVLAITGIHLTHLFDSSGLNATCLAATGARNSCRVGPFLDRTTAYFDFAHVLNIAVPAVAGLLGAFWGAPLVAGELSAGTHRLAWTQSVTRTRWFLSKLAVTGVAIVVAVGVLTLMVTIWAHPIDEVNLNRLTPGVFPARGIVPIGYAMFAFALGVSTGVLIRRSVPAIAITLVIVAALQFAIPAWLRPHLISPAQTAPALTSGSFSYLGAPPPGPVAGSALLRRDLLQDHHALRALRGRVTRHGLRAITAAAALDTEIAGRFERFSDNGSATAAEPPEPCMRRIHLEPPPPAGRDLSARQSLLGVPGH